MALCKRGDIWWIRICHRGKRVQQSTGTGDKGAAKQIHDKVKADLWNESYLDQKPERTWMEAVMRWLSESQHKRSLDDDKAHLRWLDPHLKKCTLNQITRDFVDQITQKKLADGVKNSTVDRILKK